MYGREYGNRLLRFEPSGGLMHAALVMRDKETDSYWSIMTGGAVAGAFEGTTLKELPLGTKSQWKDWLEKHSDTLVLSVKGLEHIDNNPYDNYLDSDEGFGGLEPGDDRLPAKTPIYAFQLNGRKYAVPHSAFQDGATFDLGNESIFLYRPNGAAVYYSTRAFRSRGGFVQKEGVWLELSSGARFEADDGHFKVTGSWDASPMPGFDTFWYMWSLTHPATRVLGLE